MDTPWIIGIILVIGYFIYFEWRAFDYPSRQDTLSKFIWKIGQQFPISVFWMGMLVGTLSTHFFWNWNPNCAIPGVG